MPSAATGGSESGSHCEPVPNRVARASTNDSAAQRRPRSGQRVSVPAAALSSSRPGRERDPDFDPNPTDVTFREALPLGEHSGRPSADASHAARQSLRAVAAELTRLRTLVEQQGSRITTLERQLVSQTGRRGPAAIQEGTRPKPSDQPAIPPAGWLTVPKIAERLGISPTAVRKKIRRGQLRAVDYRREGRRNADYRVDPTSVAAPHRRV